MSKLSIKYTITSKPPRMIPASKDAIMVLKLTGRSTLTPNDLALLKAEGHEVECVG